MAKILLGWEYGGGFGHVGTLVYLARTLQDLGHTAIIAATQVEATRPVWEGKGVEVIAAPLPRRTERPDAPPTPPRNATFPDVLMGLGTFAREQLVSLGRRWETLLAELKPDLVICESSPHLVLQAMRRIPTIVVGNSYSVPPAGMPCPPLRFWRDKVPDAESIHNEAVLLANLNAAAASLGLGGVDYLSDVFNGDESFVCCLPELDCYGGVRRTPAIGALGLADLRPRTTPGQGIFVYLAGKTTAVWLEGIAQSGIPAEAYIRNGQTGPVPDTIIVHEQLVDLSAVLASKALLLHHGGAGGAERALRLGVPQLIVPNHIEQTMAAMLVANTSAGDGIRQDDARVPAVLANRLNRMVRDGQLHANARRVAKAIAARDARPADEIVLGAVARLL